MNKIITLLILLFTVNLFGQTNQELLSHYKKYHEQMKSQGDAQGIINALTHLNILESSQARMDTLAAFYMLENRYVEALSTIGMEKNDSDSDLAIIVKSISLRAINRLEESLIFFEERFKRDPDPMIAFDLAEIKLETGDFSGASRNITFGIANSNENLVRNYYETQQPYSVSMKAAFLYLKALVKLNEDREKNIDSALTILNEALAIAPNFNLVKVAIDALNSQKSTNQK